MAVELMIMSGPDDGTLLKLVTPRTADGYVIGRKEDCDVMLPYDSQISRNHARLYFHDGGWRVQDMGSKNGTYLGKQKIEQSVPVKVGQMFRLGRTWLRLQAADEPLG
jgi:pSer/pThr/pTyr-binding forkhead associated (FHA) protein